MKTIPDIERAIDALPPHELAELYAWLDRPRPQASAGGELSVFEQGLDLFGSAADSALLDDVIRLTYDERRRSTRLPDVP